MSRFHALKQQARRDVHREMSLPAFYRASPTSEWQPVNVRLLRRTDKIGDIPGLEGATLIDMAPRMVFMRCEVEMPVRNAVVSIGDGQAWRVGECEPPDGISITAQVAPLPAAQTVGYPVP